MNTNRISPILAAVLVLLAVTLACSGLAAPEPTPTLVPPTNTLAPTEMPTKVPTSTSTPKPTATLPPTPAPVGSPIGYGSLEITLLDVINRESVHFGDVSGNWETFYKPLEGRFLIDVGVLVRNLEPGSAVRVKWGNVYIVESNGDAWYPGWGNTKMVDPGKKVDPFSIGLSSTALDGEDFVEFDNDTYMRLIFSVADDPDQTILFGIEDSPYISFQVEE